MAILVIKKKIKKVIPPGVFYRKIFLLFMLFSSQAGGGYAGNKDSTVINAGKILTINEICENDITNYVNIRVYLRTKIKWDYCDIKIPENPASDGQTGKKIMNIHPVIVFKDYSRYVENGKFKKEQRRGEFFVVSGKINKRKDQDGFEQYAFGDNVLSNGNKEYILKGRIRYRDAVKADESKMNDPSFLNQSNNPVYWSQTFEFEAEEILEENLKK